jgi:ABC-type branched-subunit amino acid transport system ATPase component
MNPRAASTLGRSRRSIASSTGWRPPAKAILLISSDLGEIIGMSDRIFVMNRGTIETELTGEEMTEHNVVLASSGLYRSEKPSRTGSMAAIGRPSA